MLVTHTAVCGLQGRVAQFKNTLPTVLSLLKRTASNKAEGARSVVGGLLQSMVPSLSPKQIEEPVVPSLVELSKDKDPAVAKVAVRALLSLYMSVSDALCLTAANAEVEVITNRGPKEVHISNERCLPFSSEPVCFLCRSCSTCCARS